MLQIRRSVFPALSVLAVVALVVGLFAALGSPASACMNRGCAELCIGCSGNDCYLGGRVRCEQCEDLDLLVPQEPATDAVFFGDRKVRVTIRGFESMPLDPTAHCVVAFPKLPSVASIDGLTSFDSRTGMAIEDLDFFASDVPGIAVPELAAKHGVRSSKTPWSAFRSQILDSIAAGIPSYVVVEMTLAPGVDRDTFLTELQQFGALLASPADAAGMPVGDSVFRQIGIGPLTARTAVAVEPTVPGHPGTPDQPAQY